MTVTQEQIVAVLRGERVAIEDGQVLGWRVCHPDLRSSHNYRWPWPGGVATADPQGKEYTRDDPCPQFHGDGLCIAKTWSGAASGSIPASTGLVVAYRPAHVLGEDSDKLRVSEARVLEIVDLPALIRGGRLAGANLAGANLTRANLANADLARANLTRANLTRANLANADLAGANLARVNLANADLYGADLARANLAGANLEGANLAGANLEGANPTRANLANADLAGANLARVNLANADLYGADLYGAQLTRAKLGRYERGEDGYARLKVAS